MREKEKFTEENFGEKLSERVKKKERERASSQIYNKTKEENERDKEKSKKTKRISRENTLKFLL